MTLVTEVQDEIAELLDDPDIGQDITIRKITPGAYTPADGATAAETVAPFTLRGLFFNFKDRLVDGTMIKRGDRQCFIKLKDSTYTPTAGDELVASSVKYAVIDFKTIGLAGSSITHVLQVRRG